MSEQILFKGKEGQAFYDRDLPTALEQAGEYAGEEGHVATLPEMAQARILAPKGSFAWKNWFTTTSGEYKGVSKQGNRVYVVVHGVGPLTEPGRIRQAYEEGLTRGAAKLTQEELYALLGQEGENVTILDFDKVKKLKSDVITVDSARKNDLVRARLGEHTDAYLDKYKEFYGNRIGNWHDCEGLDIDVPRGLLLFVGYSNYYKYLLGYDCLDSNGRFVGVRESAEGAAYDSTGNKGLVGPNLEQILTLKKFVPEILHKDFEKAASKLI